ncbi:MAG: GTP cyclohydrolase II RibA [Brevinema sp.]
MIVFTTVYDAIKEIRTGNAIIVINNQYDGLLDAYMVFSAEFISVEQLDFMKKYSNQVIMVSIDHPTAERLDISACNNSDYLCLSLQLPEKNQENISMNQFLSIKKLCLNLSTKEEFTSPGYIFPIVIQEKKEYVQSDHAAVALDIVKWAEQAPVAVMTKINAQISSTVGNIYEFAKKQGLKIITIDDVNEYKINSTSRVVREVSTLLPTKYGEFRIYGYCDLLTNEQHIAFVKGNIHNNKTILTRIHSECLIGDLFQSERCNCGDQFKKAMHIVKKSSEAIFIYMRQDDRRQSVMNQLKSYILQDIGHDADEANAKLGLSSNLKKMSTAAGILKNLKVKKIKLITNNINNISILEQEGIQITERIALEPKSNVKNKVILKQKKERINHFLDSN